MEHRVKVTVLDKKLFPELQAQYCAVPCRTAANAPATMLVMNSCFTATMNGMISGTWVLEHL